MEAQQKELREKTLKARDWVAGLNADIWYFNGDIDDSSVDSLLLGVRGLPSTAEEKKNKSVFLFLTTNGGSPDAAFRLARFLKKSYGRFILYVWGRCKSAGTLISLAADEIVMGDFGELGPLDVQLPREDDFIHNISGLSYNEALTMLREQCYEIFDTQFLAIQAKSGGTITAKTAAEIASRLATQLLTPIAGQIEPVKLGEIGRAINISTRYGERLLPNNPAAVQALTTRYPSHSFVIDCEEAGKILGNKVRSPSPEESLAEELLFNHVRYAKDDAAVLLVTTDAFQFGPNHATSVESDPGEHQQRSRGDSELREATAPAPAPATATPGSESPLPHSVAENGELVDTK